MKKILAIVFIVLGLVLIGTGVVLNFNVEEKPSVDSETGEKDPVIEDDITNKSIEEIMTKEKTEKDINEFTKKIFDSKITQEDLTSLTSFPFNYNDIFYGKDSYFRHLSNGLTGVDDVNKKRDAYIVSLEKNIKDNFELKLEEYTVSIDGAVIQNVSFRSYYYNVFLLDYFGVANKLISYTKYADMNEENNQSNSDQTAKDLYILNVKALEIMSTHFDDYVNNDEYTAYTLIYKKDGNVVLNDYFSFYKFVGGAGHKHINLADANRSARVDTMIKEAINNGTLDTANPFVLK